MAEGYGTPIKVGDPSKVGQDLAFYKFVIQSLPVAVVTVNAELKITGFNPWAEKLTGYSAKEVVGRYCGDILQGGMCHMECPLRTVIDRRDPTVHIETTIQNKMGQTIPVRMSTAALLDEDHKLMGGLEAFHDISQLKALELEKANLMSMFAHDMKSPLIAIQGFVLRLLAHATDMAEDKRDKYLEIIKREAGKLDHLINDFLEFSRLQTGKLNLNISTTSLEQELLELFEAYHPRALQSGIELKLEKSGALPLIEADAARLRRVLGNLLDNAFKFTAGEGKITILTQQTNHDIRIKIIDEGRGIDAEDLHAVFEPFQRGRRAEDTGGIGLGLAVVKSIVEAHGGRVLVDSELGKGSVFTVILPKTKSEEEF
ncbi:MAG: PAS domain-containing sensor histidine kinase [Syntrophobacterales bacterium]